MTAQKVIFITGAAGQWGTRLANRLAGEPEIKVVALDDSPPSPGLAGLDYIHADFRNPMIGDLLISEGAQTVVHLAFQPSRRPNDEAYAANVTETVRFLGKCVQAGVQHIVMMSSTMVYGASLDNPVLISEERPLQGSRRWGTIQDQLEIEAYMNGFTRQHPEMNITILRFANIVGPTADTPMTRYLRRHVAPTLMGFNPVMQLIHENDVVEVFAHVVLNEVKGTFNVAAEPSMPLKRILALAGITPMPVFHSFVYKNRVIQKEMVFEPDYLRYRWVADLGKMQTELGYFPEKSAEEAVQDLCAVKEEPLPEYHMHKDAGRGYTLPLSDVITNREKARAHRE